MARRGENKGANKALSPREREVLSNLYHGLSRADIATKRNLSVNAIKTVIGNIYTKLCAQNAADLVRAAVDHESFPPRQSSTQIGVIHLEPRGVFGVHGQDFAWVHFLNQPPNGRLVCVTAGVQTHDTHTPGLAQAQEFLHFGLLPVALPHGIHQHSTFEALGCLVLYLAFQKEAHDFDEIPVLPDAHDEVLLRDIVAPDALAAGICPQQLVVARAL